MPALVELVVVNELGIGALGPAARSLILLAGKNTHRHRNLNALGIEEPALYSQYRRDADTPVFVSQ